MLRELDKMTFEEVREYLNTGPGIAVVPVGSTEQHGAHGPLGTDTFAATLVAAKVAEKLDAVLAPALAYGVSTHHMNFAGTVTLRPSTVAQVVKEICESLMVHGFKLILFISGHRGNDAAIEVGATEARGLNKGCHILFMSYQDANRGRLQDVLRESPVNVKPEDVTYGSDGHGGSVETSVALAFAPGTVRFDRLGRPDREFVDRKRHLSFRAVQMIDEYAPSGIFGDPRWTSRELGEAVAESTARRIADDVRTYLSMFGSHGARE